MKKSVIYFVLSFITFPFIFNCSSGDSDPDPVVIDPPGEATLIFPNENSECTEGTNVTSTESDVTFDWNDALNADSYQLYLKNLETQETSNYSSVNSQFTLTLLRSTPYSWYVVSKNSGTQTTQSATWKFYNAGEAVSSYAPFPAELVSPEMGTSLEAYLTDVLLQWAGSDIDNDIESYDVIFGTETTPINNLGSTNEVSLSANVTSGTTYYWRVISNDSQGNSSESEIFQFKVK